MTREEEDFVGEVFIKVALAILKTGARGQLELKCQKGGNNNWMTREERGDLPELTESQFFHIYTQTEALLRGGLRASQLMGLRVAAEQKKKEGI